MLTNEHCPTRPLRRYAPPPRSGEEFVSGIPQQWRSKYPPYFSKPAQPESALYQTPAPKPKHPELHPAQADPRDCAIPHQPQPPAAPSRSKSRGSKCQSDAVYGTDTRRDAAAIAPREAPLAATFLCAIFSPCALSSQAHPKSCASSAEVWEFRPLNPPRNGEGNRPCGGGASRSQNSTVKIKTQPNPTPPPPRGGPPPRSGEDLGADEWPSNLAPVGDEEGLDHVRCRILIIRHTTNCP
jgi:hypothetical protein